MRAGERRPLSDLGLSEHMEVRVECDLSGTDISAFGLQSGQLSDDRYMIFYNQPRSPEGAIALRTAGEFIFDLHTLPPVIDEVYLTATHDDQPIGNANHLHVNFGTHTFDVKPYLKSEKAVMLIRLYRHNGAWRLATVAQGFNGGLAALVKHFGGEVAEAHTPGQMTPQPSANYSPLSGRPDVSPPTALYTPPASIPPSSSPAPKPQPAPTISLSRVELRKQKVTIELRKLGLEQEKMRVMVVMDASGSMAGEYTSGKVQETLERLVPVALKLDTDGSLEFMYYADRFVDLGTVNEHSMENFVGNQMPQDKSGAGFMTQVFGFGRKRKSAEAARRGQPDFASLGYGNNEPPVMQEIRRKHRDERQPTPTLVLFITDGGIYKDAEIEKILRESSHEDIFWQFIGLGNQDYGVLRKLDTLRGRKVDNAGFFAVDDIGRITDDELYRRLLSELPEWLRAARAARIIR